MATATLPRKIVPHATRAQIEEFLSHKRFAMIGVSRHPQDFTRGVMRDFIVRGYEPIPVHPHCKEIAGHTCYHTIQDVQPPVEAALIFTPGHITEHIVQDCAAAGIRIIWMHRGGGPGAVSSEAVDFCLQHRISVIAGECPHMFLSDAEWPHRIHGFVRKVFGSYPK